MLGLQNPELYAVGQQDTLFNKHTFGRWVLNAIWHSLVLSLVPTYGMRLLVLEDGDDLAGLWEIGNVTFTCVVFVVNIRLVLEVRYWIWTHWATFAMCSFSW